MTYGQLYNFTKTIVDHIALPNEWKVEVLGIARGPHNGDVQLRIRVDGGTCNVSGEPMAWTGRRWTIEPGSTSAQIVSTAFLAYLTALEHEAREQFKFCGAAVMDPHGPMERAVEGALAGRGFLQYIVAKRADRVAA